MLNTISYFLYFSTVSSGVNSLAAVTLEDIVKSYIKPDISEKWATRLAKILGESEIKCVANAYM